MDIDPKNDNKQPCLLIVEDSKTAFNTIKKCLGDEFLLIEARDGEEGWRLLQENPYIELVVSDINLPKMSGHQILVNIRKSKDVRLQKLPVIMMTAADDNTDKNLAFLNGANDYVSKPIDEIELQARVRVHYKLARTIRELEESRIFLSEQATTDPLTGLKNRRAFFEAGKEHLSRCIRYKTDLSIILLDIDHFKKVNDTYGHQSGDDILLGFSDLLTRMTRLGDTVARIGGEEFTILLPDTNRLGTAVMAERIRIKIEEMEFITSGQFVKITTSIGISAYQSETVDTIDELLQIADKRLYLAKDTGRNRICVNDEGKSDFIS
ncbi:MAG: diguanylate cyclase [Gammaproteobacteria bacterium]|nr:MAG: diguanylate cyclase [Gammaproteobacteria bacterium]